jgi:hypothetical protein
MRGISRQKAEAVPLEPNELGQYLDEGRVVDHRDYWNQVDRRERQYADC